MKTKTLLFGVLVAVVSMISLGKAQAQLAILPPVKIVPAQKNMIKVIYTNPSEQQVEVKFVDDNGLIKRDKINGQTFGHGFAKKYKVQRNSDDSFWVQINSQDMSVTYKMTSTRNGLWSAELENTTYHPVMASK